ncbi:unnamed protein product [Porites lobata]|uniref:Uncharacterized protein n=1 Tax=Porites lobata TaxID=104759 RepID=A0ABN8NRA2_9CNID|nr:unnamed protein product [Porites lobata]
MASRNDGDLKDKGRTLWDALKNKNIDRVERNSIIRELLQNGAPANFREPGQANTGRTPLHFVVNEIGGDGDLMDMLLKNGANANLVDFTSGHTPLHLAAEKNDLLAVKKLIENPNSRADYRKKNNVDETPLQVAERREKQLVRTYLLKLERGETDVHSGGTGVEISFDDAVVKVHADGGNPHIMIGDNTTMNVYRYKR